MGTTTGEVRECNKCHKTLDLAEFYNDKNGRSGKRSVCKGCCRNSSIKRWHKTTAAQRNEINKNRRERYPNEKEKHFFRHIKQMYKLSEADYYALFDSQDGLCLICMNPPTGSRRLYVDHDHSCCPGEKSCGNCIRGLVHSACNVAIGFVDRYRDNIDTYLNRERWSTQLAQIRNQENDTNCRSLEDHSVGR